MAEFTGVKVITIEQKDYRLGRHVVHDPRSRGFAAVAPGIDPSLWKDKFIRVYDPVPNPDQPVGNCTTCAKAMQFNAENNRKKGIRLDMDWALKAYHIETGLDEFDGQWEPDDTGSSGLASAKTAIKMGVGGQYKWFFGGGDEIVNYISTDPKPEPVSVGTWWYNRMFDLDERGFINVGGSKAGGHQWIVRGYSKKKDAIRGRCWWGEGFRDFYLARTAFNELIGDDGDAHIQERV